MSRTMSATEARVHFGEVLRRVENNETITVERGGQPKAVIVSIEQWERMKNAAPRNETWRERLERTRQRYLQEAKDVHYDVADDIRKMREERVDDLTGDLR